MVDPADMPAEAAAIPPAEEIEAASGNALRLWRKWILRIIGSIAAIMLIGLAVLNSPIGHRFVADQIAKVAPASGLRISIGRIEGSLYGKASLHHVTLSDPKGPFLTIPRVELDWRPFNWFFTGLDVRNLVARRGTLLRRAELNPGDPDAPILPNFDIRVDRFQMVDFTVAKGILGDARKIDVLAKADVRKGRVYVKATGNLGGQDKLYALLDAWPDGDKFDLALDYRAPKGGLLATLIGAKSDFQGRIVGDGTWSNWNGAILAQQDGARLAAFKLTNRAGQYGLLGQAYPARLVDGLPKKVLGDTVSLSAKGTLVDSVLNGKLIVQSAGLAISSGGAIDLGNNAFDGFKLNAVLRDPELFGKQLALKGARLSATLNGRFRNLSVAHELVVDELNAGTVLAGLRQQGTLTYDGKSWRLPLGLNVKQIKTGTATIDPRLVNGRATGMITMTGDRLASDDLRVAFNGLTAQFALRGDLARGGYGLAGPVDAKGMLIENLGTIDAHAKILFKIGTDQPWALRANFAGRMPRVVNSTLTSIAGTNIRFKGGISIGGAEPLLFKDTTLNASKLSLALNGKVVDGKTTLAGHGRHADYGPFTVQASLADDGPRAELVFASPLPAAGLKDVHVALAPIADGFKIDTHGGSMLGPFDGTLNLFSPPKGPTRVVVQRMSLSQTNISGEMTLGDGGATGALTLAGGGLDGTIRLAPRGSGQGFDADLTAKNASFAGPTPTLIRSAQIRANGVIGESGAEVNGSVYAQGISHGQLFIGKLAAKAEMRGGTGTVTASLAGRRGSTFNLQMQAQIAPKRIAVAARGNFADQPISMPRRAILTAEDGGWRLAPTQISYAGGIMIAEGRFGGSRPASGTVKLAAMPLSLADIAIQDLGLGGKISGIVEFHAANGNPPTGTAKIEVKGLTRSGLVLSSRPIDLYLVSELAADRLEMRAVVNEGGERRGRLQARISGLPRYGDLYDRLSAGSLFGQLRFAGPADALWRLAAIEVFDLTGPIRVAADVTGSIVDPHVRGRLSSDGLRMRSSLTGTDLRDIAVRGRFADSRLELTQLSGKTGNDGTLLGSGSVDLAGLGPGRGPQIDLRLAASNAQVLKRRDMAATVTGPIRIVSNGSGGTIAARLRIEKANWRLGNAADVRELPNISTREINGPPDVIAPSAPSAPWRYMIDAKASSRVAVSGMGLDSEWSADITLRGTTSDPRIGGRAEVVRGGYEFAGTRFDLTRGRIAFDQNGPIDPRLDILAETELDNLSVNVAVKGSATQPEITFTSVPALPEEEILARLLFGGSITDLSATDALQLGSALASLRGGGGLGPINKLRSAIGLDRLRIVNADPALDRETSIALGKNIGRKIYVEIITDGRGYSATDLEFRITRWLSLLGSVSTVGRQSLSAKASKDY
jgi:translocation and assembly module TamB